jgi:oligopeptide/dipeptide ABC transporter ATP-binding protein
MTLSEPLLRVDGLVKQFRTGGSVVHAVNDVDFEIHAGETLGLVGESGCGKSTLGRLIVRQLEPTEGRIVFAGSDISHLNRRALRPIRRRLQIVFQDPFSSLNPRMTIIDLLREPLRIHRLYRGAESDRRLLDLLERCGLPAARARQHPHVLSGGQRQRLAIARALVLNPELLILDEPVSALDISIQSQILNLLVDLQKELGLAYLLITHDLAAVRQVSDRIAVMYLGRMVEVGHPEEICDRPLHPYSQALLSSVPISNPRQRGTDRRIILQGDVPSPQNPPSGCTFRTRCWKATELCLTEPELMVRDHRTHPAACHYASPATERQTA